MNILPYSELNFDGKAKNRLMSIIDTFRQWVLAYNKNSRFTINLGTPSGINAAFNKFKYYSSKSSFGEDWVTRTLNKLNIHTAEDFKEFLLDQDYGRIILTEFPTMHISLAGNGRIPGRPSERTIRTMSDIYRLFNYTWNEEEALDAVDYEERHVWVVRTNYYPTLPALFIYPKELPETEEDEKELISRYEYKLATLYKYELKDSTVNAYWLARPCKYARFLKHPRPDKSEYLERNTDNNIQENLKTNTNNMNTNTLLRDRNTLKRLVESYGKQDVLNYVKHLNESASRDSLESILKSCRFFIDEPYGYSAGYSADGSDFGEFYDAKISGDILKLYIDGPRYDFDKEFLEDLDNSNYTTVIRFNKVDPIDKENIENVLSSISYIAVYIVSEDNELYQCSEVTPITGDEEDYEESYPGADYELNLLASEKVD